MNTRQKILSILETARGNTVSGEIISQELGISRAGVSKAVAVLRTEGHVIQAVTNKGYLLNNTSDVFTEHFLKEYLCDELKHKDINVLTETQSTNTLAKIAAINGCPEGTVFITDKQISGRGRRGKSFFSPSGGIYMSIVLRPDIAYEDSVNLTSCASVAVCQAIKKTTGFDTKIKWVNDIFLNDKKLVGILTEATTSVENSTLEYAVVGVGINFCIAQNDFPEELQDIATSLYTENPGENLRTKLAAEVLNSIWELEKKPNSPDILAEYKALSLVLGKKITVLTNPPRVAVAVDINNKGNLLVEYENGETDVICSGEVSILPVQPERI